MISFLSALTHPTETSCSLGAHTDILFGLKPTGCDLGRGGDVSITHPFTVTSKGRKQTWGQFCLGTLALCHAEKAGKYSTGDMLRVNNVLMSWNAKRQDCVTLSSVEAQQVVLSMV